MKDSYERISYRYPFESLVLFQDKETGLFGIRSGRTGYEKTELSSPERVMLEVFIDREKFGISSTEALQVLSTDSATLEKYKSEFPSDLPKTLRDPREVEERAVLLNYEYELKGEMKERFCEAMYENIGIKPGVIDMKEAEEIYEYATKGHTLADAIEKIAKIGFSEYAIDSFMDKVEKRGNEKHLTAVKYMQGEAINSIEASEVDEKIREIIDKEDRVESEDPFEATAKEYGVDLQEDKSKDDSTSAYAGEQAEPVTDEKVLDDNDQTEDDYPSTEKGTE